MSRTCLPHCLKRDVLLAGLTLAILFSATTLRSSARAQSSIFRSEAERVLLNANRVGLATGSPSGVYSVMGANMATILDDQAKDSPFRLVVSLSQGSLNNIDDLRYLDRIDVAIVQSDVLERFRADPATYASLNREIRMVAPLHLEEIHLLARGGITNIRDLDGKRVNIGAPSSGTQITARNIFSRLNIHPRWDERTTDEARDALVDGEIDAMMFVVGKPAGVFSGIKGDVAQREQIQFVPIEAAVSPYVASRLTSGDYQNLIVQSESVATLASPAVMVVYAFTPQSPRYALLRRFVDRFFSNAPALTRSGFSRNWCQVNLSQPVAGWQRFSGAEDWLRLHPNDTGNLCERAGAQCTCPPAMASCQAQARSHAQTQGIRIDDFSKPLAISILADWKRTHRECIDP